MKIIEGKYNQAKVFTDNIEEKCIEQIQTLLSQEVFKDAHVRIMPDCHAGKGCVIGFTADLSEKVIPNLVGVDIGCGMYCIELGKINIDYELLDEVIREHIPLGMNVREEAVNKIRIESLLDELIMPKDKIVNFDRLDRSVGTLGGGNHFIEVDEDDKGIKYLVIHTGSRNLGLQVANYYQDLAIKQCHKVEERRTEKEEAILRLKSEGNEHLIAQTLANIERKYANIGSNIPTELCYLSGSLALDYKHDMEVCQYYADLNRKTIADIILQVMGIEPISSFTTMHNYIDFTDNVIRKGSISAKKGEQVIIPMNMVDGALICIGKGNPDWNCSAPHGAGRIMSRAEAKRTLNMQDYIDSMKGIFTTSVCEGTLDECYKVYKPTEEIKENIKDTVDIIKVIKPKYNIKAEDDDERMLKRNKKKLSESQRVEGF